MEYKVIMEGPLEKLEAKVRQAIAEGWKPQGGIAVSMTSLGMLRFAQAMVK
ncbi:MAG: DUF1737 domain-containing protein [Dehalococcoidia bacterium]|nr:DUF1737 domain-containing protein [Dehalococcoidia bacterium]